MTRIDQVISLVFFVTFALFTLSYFTQVQLVTKSPLETFGFDISTDLLTENYLLWNATKLTIFVNTTRSYNMYPVEMSYNFGANVNMNSTKLGNHYNTTLNSIVFLGNLSSGVNFFNLYYSEAVNLTQRTIASDLVRNGLSVSNGYYNITLTSAGGLSSVIYNGSSGLLVSEFLYVGSSPFSATSYTVDANDVRVKYNFTDGTDFKIFSFYAYSPIVRINVSSDSTWVTRWTTGFTNYYADGTGTFTDSNTTVYTGIINFVDVYDSSRGVSFSGSNMSAKIFDGNGTYREVNLTGLSNYQLAFHAGGYTNGLNVSEMFRTTSITAGMFETIDGISSDKITSFNQTNYKTLKNQLGVDRDLRVEIENITSQALLLDYGETLPSGRDIIVYKKYENLLTEDYEKQNVIFRVKTW